MGDGMEVSEGMDGSKGRDRIGVRLVPDKRNDT